MLELSKALALPESFAEELDPTVRATFLELRAAAEAARHEEAAAGE